MVEKLNDDTKWVNQLVTLEQKYAWDLEYGKRKASAEARAEGIAEGEARMAALFAALNTAGR